MVSKIFFSNSTVPLAVSSVSVTERTVTTVTLKWQDVGKGWSYLLQINGMDVTPDVSQSFVSYPVTSLEPGTEYRFSVITMFSGLNSTAYEGFTVTGIYTGLLSDKRTNLSSLIFPYFPI